MGLFGRLQIIDKGTSDDIRDEVINNLKSIQQKDRSLFELLEELIIRGSISGAAGNFLYSCLQALARCF